MNSTMQNNTLSNTVPLGMIESKFPALRWQKAAKENRSIPLREIAEATNLSMGTVHKLSKGDIRGIRIETIDALCRYFDVTIGELIEYKKD